MSTRTDRKSRRAMGRGNMMRATERLRREIAEIVKVIPSGASQFDDEITQRNITEAFDEAFRLLRMEWN